jgi:hypothetical protein
LYEGSRRGTSLRFDASALRNLENPFPGSSLITGFPPFLEHLSFLSEEVWTGLLVFFQEEEEGLGRDIQRAVHNTSPRDVTPVVDSVGVLVMGGSYINFYGYYHCNTIR